MKKEPTRLAKTTVPQTLLKDLRGLIESARERVATRVNAEMTLLYWQVGNRIRRDILDEKRADYGEKILQTLSAELKPEFGRGFGARNLAYMVRFAEVFTDQHIVATLSAQLSWSHFVAIIPFDDDLKRDFYAEMCRIERWSVRTFRDLVASHCQCLPPTKTDNPRTLAATRWFPGSSQPRFIP